MSRRRTTTGGTDAPTPAGPAGATGGAPPIGAGQGAAGGAATGAATAAGTGAATGGIVDQAKQTTGQVVGQAQEQAATRLDRQKEAAAAGLSSVADAVRQMGQNLRGQAEGQSSPVVQYAAQYGERAADQIGRLTEYLRRNDVNQLVREVEGFARRQPALFVGGAFLLGLAGSRFLKSSRPAPELPGAPPDASRALPPLGGTTPSAGAGTGGSVGTTGTGTTPGAVTDTGD